MCVHIYVYIHNTLHKCVYLIDYKSELRNNYMFNLL